MVHAEKDTGLGRPVFRCSSFVIDGWRHIFDQLLQVEEKLGEQNFRVFSEMRGEILVYRPWNLKILGRNVMKMKNWTLPKFEISILKIAFSNSFRVSIWDLKI